MEKSSENITCCVIAPTREKIRPWIRSYFANGNTTPLVILKCKGEWSDDDCRYCSSAAEFSGGFVIDFGSVHSDVSAVVSVVKKLHPKTFAYIDDSTFVTGNIDECFSYSERAPGFVLARFVNPSSIDNRHPESVDGHNLFDSSPIIFHGMASDMILSGFDVEKDKDVRSSLSRLYESDNAWHEGFCDYSIRNWSSYLDDPEKYLENGTVFTICSESAAGKWDDISKSPPAPFEGSVREEGPCDDGAIDAVFVIGTGSIDGNEELRYALRNIERNCKFVRDVYICGYCPPWVDKKAVKHLNWPDRFRHAKDANIIDKLRHACEHRGIAKRILFCSDDQFQTRECSWDDFCPRYLRQFDPGDRWYADKRRVWHSRLKKTLDREVKRRKDAGLDTKEVFYYQPHIWMQIDRDRFIDYARWCNYETRDDTIIASGYFNFIGADGKPDFDHMFLADNDRKVPDETHVAYHDGSEKAAMRILRSMFPDRSRFELDDGKGAKLTRGNEAVNEKVHAAKDSGMSSYDPSTATNEEISEIHEISKKIRNVPEWNSLLGEVSRAEELRLFGVKGWRVVWRDIIRRWRGATCDGMDVSPVIEGRSKEASAVIGAYMSDPDGMRTVRFGTRDSYTTRSIPSFGRKMPRTAPDEVAVALRSRIRKSLHDRIKG